MSDDILLSVKNLTIDFKTEEGVVRAVNNISFDIPKGKTVGLVGESGSGKSVTSLAIMGLIPNPPGEVTNGEIILDGVNLLEKSDSEMRSVRGNKVSMIFQEPMTSLNPVFTVGDQIMEALMLHKGLNKKEAYKRAIELMDEVGIPTPEIKVNSYPHEMSGGQKQRVMIAIAIACEPELLIADEPTTALDVTIQKQVIELMLSLQKKYGMSILFITHDLGVIGDLADDVVVMYRGDLVEQNVCYELYNNPKHPYTKGLLACRPSLEKNPSRLATVSDFMNEKGEEITPNITRVSIDEVKDKTSAKHSDIILEINNVKKYFPIKGGLFGSVKGHVKAVDDVSFKVKKGETLGLVGESGCGKTTLGRTILKLIEPTEGQIIYKGQDITNLTPREMRPLRRNMQIIFQDPYSSLNPRMSIAEILTEPMQIHNIGENQKERLDMAGALLQKVGLKAIHLPRHPHEFSGGQRQRICIARALTLKPEFIICDESVSALDVSIQAQILNLLLDLQDEFGLTYIFISHDLSVVKFISHEVGVMNQGKLVEFEKYDDLYRNPKEEYTRQLLDAIPKGIPSHL